MGISFSKYMAICEIFSLEKGRVLSFLEAIEDVKATVNQQIANVQANYKPDPFGEDHLVAACIGLKPAAVISYQHHASNPAADAVSDEIKKDGGNTAEIQAELLKHGFKVRPDFYIIHMNLPKITNKNIIVGGKSAVEELWKLFQCQYYLDLASGSGVDKANQIMKSKCTDLCTFGDAGFKCKPIHQRIGQLLGYTKQQVDDFLQQLVGYNHIPDIEYPIEVPSSLASVPRQKSLN